MNQTTKKWFATQSSNWNKEKWRKKSWKIKAINSSWYRKWLLLSAAILSRNHFVWVTKSQYTIADLHIDLLSIHWHLCVYIIHPDDSIQMLCVFAGFSTQHAYRSQSLWMYMCVYGISVAPWLAFCRTETKLDLKLIKNQCNCYRFPLVLKPKHQVTRQMSTTTTYPSVVCPNENVQSPYKINTFALDAYETTHIFAYICMHG